MLTVGVPQNLCTYFDKFCSFIWLWNCNLEEMQHFPIWSPSFSVWPYDVSSHQTVVGQLVCSELEDKDNYSVCNLSNSLSLISCLLVLKTTSAFRHERNEPTDREWDGVESSCAAVTNKLCSKNSLITCTRAVIPCAKEEQLHTSIN